MVCASKPWSISSACENFRGQQPLGAEIVDLVQTHMSYFLDSGPKFTGLVSLNAEGIVLDHISFWIFSDQSRNFACFWPQNFWGRASEFLDLRYKIGAHTDHVAKFHGDRTRELGDPMAN